MRIISTRPLLKYFFPILFFISLLSSCSKQSEADLDYILNENDSLVEDNLLYNNIYIAGYESIGKNNVALYWLNNKMIKLGNDTSYSRATDICVNNTDIYVSGVIIAKKTYNGKAVYWKNNKKIELTNGIEYAIANSICVFNNDVYVAGVNNGHATYWKNGIETILDGGAFYSVANAIYIERGNVYIAGYENKKNYGNSMATYWENGKKISLSNGEKISEAIDIYVKGTDVYITGHEFNATTQLSKVFLSGKEFSGIIGNDVATYWKNGNQVYLTDGINPAYTTSLFVNAENDLFITGGERINSVNRAVYWKNGIKVNLAGENEDAAANAIFINKENIYIAGTTFSKSMYWENNVPINLLNSSNNSSSTSIWVN